MTVIPETRRGHLCRGSNVLIGYFPNYKCRGSYVLIGYFPNYKCRGSNVLIGYFPSYKLQLELEHLQK